MLLLLDTNTNHANNNNNDNSNNNNDNDKKNNNNNKMKKNDQIKRCKYENVNNIIGKETYELRKKEKQNHRCSLLLGTQKIKSDN